MEQTHSISKSPNLRVTHPTKLFIKQKYAVVKSLDSVCMGKKPYADGIVEHNYGILSLKSALKNAHYTDNFIKLPETALSFPTLLHSALFPASRKGFVELPLYKFLSEPMCPLNFNKDTQMKKLLAQKGETPAVDPIVITYLKGIPHLLVAIRPNGRVTIAGGGMIDPGEEPRKAALREIYEEAVKHLPEEEACVFNKLFDTAPIIYSGIVSHDHRNCETSWMSTIAFRIIVPEKIALSMELGTTLDHEGDIDVEHPQWMPITKYNLNKLMESHRVLVERALAYNGMRYVQSIEYPWSSKQLSRFRSVMLNQNTKKIDVDWARSDNLDELLFLNILGSYTFDKQAFYSAMSYNGKKEIMFWDPIEKELADNNYTLYQQLKYNMMSRKCSLNIFVFTKNLYDVLSDIQNEIEFVIRMKNNYIIFVPVGEYKISPLDFISDNILNKLLKQNKIVEYTNISDIIQSLHDIFCEKNYGKIEKV